MAISTNGTVLARVAGALYNTQMSNATYSEVKALDPATLVNTLYARDFASSTDLAVATTLVTNLGLTSVAGLTNWVAAQLTAAGTGNKGAKIVDLLNGFAQLTADATYGAAATAFNATVDAALVLSQTTGNAGGTFAAAGVVAVTNATFTLTTGVDQGAAFTGGAGNDTFTAISAGTAAATNTLNAADVLVGGAGADTLNITVTATDTNTLGSAQITGIETINVRSAVAGQTATVDASAAVGATLVNANAGAGAVTVTALATGAAIGVVGNGTVTNGTTSYAYATAATPQTINVSNGVVGGNITATSSAAVTTATINSTGAANSVGTVLLASAAANTVTSLTVNASTDLTATLTGADYATAGAALVVTGAGKVSIGSAGTFKTVDASASTGGLTMTIDTVTTSFKGTSGNDTITTVTLAAPAAGIVDAGAGTADKLVIAAAADVATATLRGSYTNFEVISNATTGGVAADGFAGVTSLETSGDAGGFTAMTAAQAANIAVSVAQTGGVTYALTNATGTSDVLGLTLGTGKTTAAALGVAGTLTVTGFETLNLTANPGPTATVGANKTSTVAALAGSTLKAVNLTGTAFSITNGATTVATTFDASALTGDGTVAGSKGLTIGGSLVSGSTVTGSALIDTVTIGAIGSTYNTGAGNDSITTTQAISLGSIINAGSGTDTLVLSDTGTVVVADNTFTNVSGVEKLSFSGATGLTFAVGGYANSIATVNAGVLEVTAAALTAAATIDGTGLAAGNALKLTLTNLDGAANATATTITLSTGADNIKMTQTDATNTTTDTITISGGAAALAATTAKTIDLSAVTAGGAIAVTTGAGADVIKAAAIAGTYTGGKGSDTFTAGAGVDTFAMGTTGSVAGTDLDVIVGYGTAVDILTFGANTTVLAADSTGLVAGANVQTSAGGLVTFATADNTLALKIAAIQADLQLDAAGSVAVFNDGGNAYVYYAGAAIGNADDQVIQLTGITAASIAGGATTIVS